MGLQVFYTSFRIFCPQKSIQLAGQPGSDKPCNNCPHSSKKSGKRDKFQDPAQSGHVTPLLSCDTPSPRRLFFHLIWNNIPSVTTIKSIFASYQIFSLFCSIFTATCTVSLCKNSKANFNPISLFKALLSCARISSSVKLVTNFEQKRVMTAHGRLLDKL